MAAHIIKLDTQRINLKHTLNIKRLCVCNKGNADVSLRYTFQSKTWRHVQL